MPHMIRHHHFFQSPQVSHRVDPEKVIRMFDLKPGVNYAPKYVTTLVWTIRSAASRFDSGQQEKMERLMKVLAVKTSKTEKLTIYVFPCGLPILGEDYTPVMGVL
jgi:hypothetical protein